MAQEVFEEDMIKGGKRPLLIDAGKYRIIQFDEDNVGIVEHKDDVVARRGENKGQSRSKWEMMGYYSTLPSAIKRLNDLVMIEKITEIGGNLTDVLNAIKDLEKNLLNAFKAPA
jgi:hypothetical protein